MKIIDLKKGKTVLCADKPLILALGNFDGVHSGHLELIRNAVEEGRKQGIKTAAWTFEEHPQNIISGRKIVSRLTFDDEKNEIFASAGLDYAIYESFSRVRNFSPERFIKEVLIEQNNCRTAFCGFNFSFGKNGEGTPDILKNLMQKYGGRAVVVPPVLRMNKIVSSTAVRFFVENGLMEEAAELLGRPYSINFPVLRGNRLGRTIGLPTINQSFPSDHIKPKNGIYCCTCYIGDDIFLGVANVGSRPTVNSDTHDVNCETHIINYNGWLYGKRIKLCFYKRLRDEKKFADLSELKNAVEHDKSAAIEYFSKK